MLSAASFKWQRDPDPFPIPRFSLGNGAQYSSSALPRFKRRLYHDFAAWMKSRTLVWSFLPGPASTPLDTSTP